ncbi:Glycosyltransferase family 15 protein [Balamuthia mandrillaris]
MVTALIMVNISIHFVLFGIHAKCDSEGEGAFTTGNHKKLSLGKGNIAVVRPFIPSHLDQLLSDMARWNEASYFPCPQEGGGAPPAGAHGSMELVFYFSYDFGAAPDVVQQLETAWRTSLWRRCFTGMSLLSAGLDPAKDVYLPGRQGKPASASSGPVVMFFDLFEREEFWSRFDFFLLMEPDVVAVREGWLTQLRAECLGEHLNQDFWMKGSMYVGRKYVSNEHRPDPWLYHINGNALYHVGDPQLRAFMKEVRETQGLGNPFDISIYEYWHGRFLLCQDVVHRFRYTPYLRHYGVASYSLSDLRENHPHTFLVHKKLNCNECDEPTE